MAVHCPPLLLGYPLCWALQYVVLQNRLEHVLEHVHLRSATAAHVESGAGGTAAVQPRLQESTIAVWQILLQ